MNLDDRTLAARVLEARLEVRHPSPLKRAAKYVGAFALAVMGGGDDLAAPTFDLVVVRSDSDAPVLRVNAGTDAEASRLLETVRRDLGEKTVRDFFAEWRLLDA